MITYTTNLVKLGAFEQNTEVLFIGSDKLVFVDVKAQIQPNGYTFLLRLFVNNQNPHSYYVNKPAVFKIDCGAPILGTWSMRNSTNVFTHLLVTLGHVV
jgi:hypothetical protein